MPVGYFSPPLPWTSELQGSEVMTRCGMQLLSVWLLILQDRKLTQSPTQSPQRDAPALCSTSSSGRCAKLAAHLPELQGSESLGTTRPASHTALWMLTGMSVELERQCYHGSTNPSATRNQAMPGMPASARLPRKKSPHHLCFHPSQCTRYRP